MSDTHGTNAGQGRRPVLWLLTVVAVIVTGWALRSLAAVLVPLVLSFFLALIVYPLDRTVARRLPWWLAWIGHALALSVLLLVLLGFLGCIWLAAGQLIERFQDADYQDLLPSFRFYTPDAEGAEGSLLSKMYSEASRSLASQASERIPDIAQGIVNAAGAMLAGLSLVIFLTLMMLIEAPAWHAKLDTATTKRAEHDLRHALLTIADRLRRYLLIRAAMGVLTAVLYAAWLWLFGIDLILVWALLAFALNFVPTLGSLLSGVLPVIYAFTQKDPGTAFFIGAGIFAIEQVIGNFVDPRVQGKQVSVSPVVILIVLVFWSWLWGIAGTLLAVPISAALVIFFSHFKALRPIALFLSNETSMDDLERATDTAPEKLH